MYLAGHQILDWNLGHPVYGGLKVLSVGIVGQTGGERHLCLLGREAGFDEWASSSIAGQRSKLVWAAGPHPFLLWLHVLVEVLQSIERFASCFEDVLKCFLVLRYSEQRLLSQDQISAKSIEMGYAAFAEDPFGDAVPDSVACPELVKDRLIFKLLGADGNLIENDLDTGTHQGRYYHGRAELQRLTVNEHSLGVVVAQRLHQTKEIISRSIPLGLTDSVMIDILDLVLAGQLPHLQVYHHIVKQRCHLILIRRRLSHIRFSFQNLLFREPVGQKV